MITQYEVSTLLRQEIPQLTDKMYPSRASLEVYASMNYFSDYTKETVRCHNTSAAKRCFILAERLFRQGDHLVKMLIENVFVYGFSGLLMVDDTEKKYVRSMIPDTLYTLYLKQVSVSGGKDAKAVSTLIFSGVKNTGTVCVRPCCMNPGWPDRRELSLNS